ncbi:MAG: DNA gyrase inhibitor YacG [Candidatus Omnitrophota bacterium]
MTNPTIYHCRHCGAILPEGRQTRWFPFCSERCKLTDLGRWLMGDYRIREEIPCNEAEILAEMESEPE